MDKIKIVLDLANNAQGSIDKGKQIINEHYSIIKNYTKSFDFYFKFQYRQISSSFIHPDYKKDFSFKYVKRFTETEMSMDNYLELVNYVKDLNDSSVYTMCTPFDSDSVKFVEEHNFDAIKIASCSANDWDLIERVAETNLPIYISVAGAEVENIDKVIDFLTNRKKEIILNHCVAEYPTSIDHLELNQIDFLKSRYPDIPIGFSTHEYPNDLAIVKIAIGKGVVLLERHIDIDCETKNKYSSAPQQISDWLFEAEYALRICGVLNKRYIATDKENEALQGLKRAVFVNKNLKADSKITKDDLFFAIPKINENQLVADDISKYKNFILKKNLKKNEALLKSDVEITESREIVLKIVKDIKALILESGIAIPDKIEMELSHHYGIDKYYETGVAILDCINNDEYCKKLLILLPSQNHPSHYHIKKRETFCVLYGELGVVITEKDGSGSKSLIVPEGEMFEVNRGIRHSFSSMNGCIFEEVSTTHFKNDSYYNDEFIMNNYNDRKTKLTFYSDWLVKDLK